MNIVRKLMLCCLFIYGTAAAQNSSHFFFSQRPENYQLYARNNQNTATVTFAGTISVWNPVYQYVKLKVYKRTGAVTNPYVLQTTVQTVPQAASGGSGTFSVSYTITAGLQDYKFEFGYRANNSDNYFQTVSEVVCGDAYIMTGQSNSVAPWWDEAPAPQSSDLDHYCRGYGKHFEVTYSELPAGQWGEGRVSWGYNAYVGTVALRLSKNIINQFSVPVAFINGGSGGTRIDYHLPGGPMVHDNNNVYAQISLYDFLVQRCASAGLTQKIKAIFWNQGEAEALEPSNTSYICDYPAKFRTLYNSWKNAFPSVSKIYMFQMTAFGVSPIYTDDRLTRMRDVQRDLAGSYPDISLVTTLSRSTSDLHIYFDSNLNQTVNDDVHYSVAGYYKLADLAYRQLANDFYAAGTFAASLSKPAIVQRIYKPGSQTIQIEFNQPVIAQPAVNGNQLRDYFFDEYGTKLPVSSVTASGNSIFLNLLNPYTPKSVTYLPSGEYDNGTNAGSGTTYVGPYITSTDNFIGAASFFRFPLTSNSDAWSVEWQNAGDGMIAGQISSYYKYLAFDYNNDGAEELLTISANASNNWAEIHKYNPSTKKWDWIWSNNGSNYMKTNSTSAWMIRPGDIFIPGDYNGDGLKNEILCIDPANGRSSVIRYSTVTADFGTYFTGLSGYIGSTSSGWPLAAGQKFVTGDFNSDGYQNEVLCIGNSSARIIRYSSSDFQQVWTNNNNGFLAFPYYSAAWQIQSMDEFIPTDANGDGFMNEIACVNMNGVKGALLSYSVASANFQTPWTNSGNTFGGYSLPFQKNEQIFSANFDGDAKDEIMIIPRSATAGNAVTETTNASGQYAINWSSAAMSNWTVTEINGSNSFYLPIRTVAGQPEQILAMRYTSCGYHDAALLTPKTGNNFRMAGMDSASSASVPVWNVYPVPSSDNVNITCNTFSSEAKYQLADVTGRLIDSGVIMSGSHILDVSACQSGVYLLLISDKGSTETKRIIVRH